MNNTANELMLLLRNQPKGQRHLVVVRTSEQCWFLREDFKRQENSETLDVTFASEFTKFTGRHFDGLIVLDFIPSETLLAELQTRRFNPNSPSPLLLLTGR